MTTRDEDRLEKAVIAMRSLEVADPPDDLIRLTPPSTPLSAPPQVRRSRSVRFAAAAIAALVLVCLFLTTRGGGASMAFAQVAERVNATRTLKAMITVDGQRGRLYVSGTRSRFEGDGVVVLADSKSGEEVMLQRTTKVAYWVPRGKISRALDFYGIFRDLSEMTSAPIADHVDSEGRRYPGAKGQAVVKLSPDAEWKFDAEIWSDPRSELPVRLKIHAGDAGAVLVDLIEFDVPLDEGLFDLAIPPGYEVAGITRDELKAELSKEEAARLIMKPGVGVGDVRFGMTRAEIVQLLGAPEFTLHKTYLNYPSMGLQLALLGPEGRETLGMIIANPWDAANLTKRDFPGNTAEGISMGSTVEQVHEAYGEPDPPPTGKSALPEGLHMDGYGKRGLSFGYTDGKVAQIIMSRNVKAGE
jgi:outer membrane lipoprotein-sorting protein